jgi:iron complex outermembrane receptor protein
LAISAQLPPATARGDDAGGGSDGASAPAGGQETQGRPREARPQIEEIIVTARKRDEYVQKIPISIAVLSGDRVDDAGVMRVDQIAKLTPNLLFDTAIGSSNASRISLRGVGNTDPIASRDNGVGVYLDGIYLARAQGQLVGLADIQRIEVLRGPQGTLFGRNTVGGAIHIVTRAPGDELEASGTVRLGNFGLFETRGSVNVPLMPELAAARISFQTATRDGYTKNRRIDVDTDDRRLLAAHLSLRVTPNDSMDWRLSAEQSRAHDSGRGGECRFGLPAGAASLSAAAPIIAAYQGAGVDFVGGCMQSQADGELNYSSLLQPKSNLDTWGVSSNFTWSLSGVTLKSLSSWRRQENETLEAFDYTTTDFVLGPLSDINHARVEETGDQQDQVSQELNLGGTALGGRLAWTAGAFGFYEKTTPGQVDTTVALLLCQVSAAVCAASNQQNFRAQTFAWAGYGQVTYDVTDRVHVTAGLRRSQERKRLKQRLAIFATATTLNPTFASDQAKRFDAWTPLLNVSIDVFDDAIVYGTYSRGFKSGGFNARPTPTIPATLLPFEQEDLQNYEIGFKSSWFERRLQANLALFHGNYDNIQLTELFFDPMTGAFSSRVGNAGRAVIRGGELEVQARPLDALELSMALGVLDSKYKQFDYVNVATNVFTDRSDEDLLFVPTYTGSFGVAYTISDAFRVGDLTARASWSFRNGVNFGPDFGSERLAQDKVGLLSGQLSLALDDGKTVIALFADNLLDRRYIDSGVNFETGFAFSTAHYGPPRMYGMEIRRSF